MLARSGIIAALYVALTFACLPVSGGLIQFRLSEMLTVLPLFYVEAIPALAVGCLISNIVSGCAAWDIFLGTAITLVAAFFTFLIGKIFKNVVLKISLGGLFPVALNAFGLPLIWIFLSGTEAVYFVEVGYLTISQGVMIWGFGTVLYLAVSRLIGKNISAFLPYRKSDRQ